MMKLHKLCGVVCLISIPSAPAFAQVPPDYDPRAYKANAGSTSEPSAAPAKAETADDAQSLLHFYASVGAQQLHKNVSSNSVFTDSDLNLGSVSTRIGTKINKYYGVEAEYDVGAIDKSYGDLGRVEFKDRT